jgi:hypothetical protein
LPIDRFIPCHRIASAQRPDDKLPGPERSEGHVSFNGRLLQRPHLGAAPWLLQLLRTARLR